MLQSITSPGVCGDWLGLRLSREKSLSIRSVYTKSVPGPKMKTLLCLLLLVQNALGLITKLPGLVRSRKPSLLTKFHGSGANKQELSKLSSSRVSEAVIVNPPSTNFQYLKKLDARVKRLSDGESDFLLSFWSDSLKCFQIYPNMSTTRVSVTTTCMAISAILANPLHWERSCRWDEIPGGLEGLAGIKFAF